MELIDLSKAGRDDLLSGKEIYKELYSLEDVSERMFRRNEIIERAASLQIKGRVVEMLKILDAEERKRVKKREALIRKEHQEEMLREANVTQFDYGDKDYPVMSCGSWLANEGGIQTSTFDGLGQYACRHPIIMIKRLTNLETGEEQVTLAFKPDDYWVEKTVPKFMISKASEIVELSKYGVLVNSDNAKLLMRYLAELQIFNKDIIQKRLSTSKFGWQNKFKQFIPYDKGIEFDARDRFRDLCISIESKGTYNEWLNIARDVRNKHFLEPRIALAASFASVILKIMQVQPFIVDFFGLTEGGKTVTLMLAASVWANPSESMYIGDFKTTDTSLEVRADMLNNMPLILDDTSKASNRIRENFESLVYDLCSGKGKSRSNKELGANRECHWHLCTICNGERPLSGFMEQGGAINRIIEIECGEKIFDNPRDVAEGVRKNYGHAGRIFIDYIKTIDPDDLIKLLRSYEDALTTSETMQKQVLAMASVLVADELATKCVFQDGNNLQPDDVKRFLTSRKYVDDGARCYQYILDTFNISQQHFDIEFSNIDQWGEYNPREETISFYISALENILAQRGYNRKSFTSWAKKHNLLICDTDRDTKVIRFSGGKRQRAIVLRIDYSFFQNENANNVQDSPFD